MKTRLLLAIVLSTASMAAHSHGPGELHSPRHGGVVAQARGLDLELVASNNQLQIYVNDHDKPVDLSQANARITLLAGTEKQEVALLPKDGRFVASGTFKVAAGTRAVAHVTLGGKTLTARFVVR